MICTYCGTVLDHWAPHLMDEDGGARCLAHPPESDAMNKAEDVLNRADAEIAGLERLLEDKWRARSKLWRTYCTELTLFQAASRQS